MQRFLVALSLMLALPLAAQEGEQERIDALVRQLGADDPSEREAASQALRKIGKPALTALKYAAGSYDAEVRARANEILPYVRWDLPPDCPDAVYALLTRYESADADGRASVLHLLAEMHDPSARKALYQAWWEVDNPRVVTTLAMDAIDQDTDIAEERLRALQAHGDPRVAFQALAEVREFRWDWSGAADFLGREVKANGSPLLQGVLLDFLLRAHRYEEALQYRPGSIEILVHLGRREQAEQELMRGASWDESRCNPLAMDIALPYGLARPLLEAAGDDGQAYGERAVRGWIREGDLSRAARVLLGMKASTERKKATQELLEARGDFDLLMPAFLEEASRLDPADAQRHLRLAKAYAEKDPEIAGREWKKATLLDPSLAREAPADEVAPPSSGCRSVRLSAMPDDFVFASSPTRIGEFYYYANRDGDLLKVRDPLRPEPVWTYTPPTAQRVNCAGRAFGCLWTRPTVSRWKGKILALYERTAGTREGSLHESGGNHWVSGRLLCVVDEETGKEVWTRPFLRFTCGRLFPDEGLLVFSEGATAVYDLETCDWRWSLDTPGSDDAWARGDAVYVGFTSGVLCKLRASDGTLLWRREWSSDARHCVLDREGGRLLFRTGERLICLSLANDSLQWEAPVEKGIDAWRVASDGERVYVFSWTDAVASISLSDGKRVWCRCSAGGTDWVLQGLLDHTWYIASKESCVFLDSASGEALGVAWGQACENGRSPRYACDGLLCTGGEPDIFARLRLKSSESTPVDPPLPLRAIRIARAPQASGTAEAQRDDDPLATVSLMEDLCAGPRPRDAAAWLALAEACLQAGRTDAAAQAAATGLLLAGAQREKAHEWRERLAQAKPPLSSSAPGARALEKWEEEQTAEAGFLRGELAADSARSFANRLREGTRDVVARRAVAALRQGVAKALPLVAESLGEMEDAQALDAIACIFSFAAKSGNQDRSLWGSWPDDATALLAGPLHAALSRKDPAVRGAAQAALEELGEAPRQEAEQDLRAALAEKDTCIRLLAAASLTRRGADDAKDVLLHALASRNDDERGVALWLVGRLRLAEAVARMRFDPKFVGDPPVAAFAAIGTDEAMEQLLAWARAERHSTEHPLAMEDPLAQALIRWRSPKAIEALVEMARDESSFSAGDAGCDALCLLGAPEGRAAIIDHLRLKLRMDPEDIQARYELLRGYAAEGMIKEAEECLVCIDALASPVWWRDDSHARVLAAKGDLAGARESRRRAEERLIQSRAVAPSSWQLIASQAKLYIEPDVIADVTRALALLDEAKKMAPHEAEIERLIARARPK